MPGIEALNVLTLHYQRLSKKLHLKNLSEDCLSLLNKADEVIEINIGDNTNIKIPTGNLTSAIVK